MAYDATDFVVTVDPLTLTTPRERLEYLRDFLRTLPAPKFDIRHTHTVDGEPWGRLEVLPNPEGCGTAACILGWSQHVFKTHHAWCDELLGLDIEQLRDLYMPSGWNEIDGHIDAFRPTAHDAAEVIDRLLRTGKVDWSIVRDD